MTVMNLWCWWCLWCRQLGSPCFLYPEDPEDKVVRSWEPFFRPHTPCVCTQSLWKPQWVISLKWTVEMRLLWQWYSGAWFLPKHYFQLTSLSQYYKYKFSLTTLLLERLFSHNASKHGIFSYILTLEINNPNLEISVNRLWGLSFLPWKILSQINSYP